MMARLLTEEAIAPNEPTEPSKQIPTTPARRLSFKTRQAAARSNYRATKVSLSSTNVALIASKFNTIVIDDSSQGRALLRKISGNQWKPSAPKEVKMKTRGEGVVKAAIEIFEHHDLEKYNIKPPYKSKTDLRPKLVVVRKSSSRSSIKQGASQNNEPSKSLDTHSKESAKDSRNSENKKNEHPLVNTFLKEVKRRPSLKEKPVLKHRPTKINKKDDDILLDQKIAKFSNSNEINKKPTEQCVSQTIVKPTFDLTERIAQFNKNEDIKPPDINRINTTRKIEKGTKTMISTESDGKDIKQSITKSILKNTYNKQSSLLEKTKDKISSIVLQDDLSKQQAKNPDKKQSFIKDKFMAREKKGLTVFISKTDSTKSFEETDEGYPRLHSPKDTSILEKALGGESYFPVESLPDINEHNLKTNKPMSKVSHRNPIYVQEVSTAESLRLEKGNTGTSPDTDVGGRSSVKPTVIPYTSDNPKFEKSYCKASDLHDKLQLDRIKPNNSFLWKPVLTSVVKELPIYDDGPHINEFKSDIQISSKNNEDVFTIPAPEKENFTTNPLDLNVASSFILEMTEQIERRFSTGSQQDISADDSSFEQPCTEKSTGNKILVPVSENVVIKNPSFLHGKRLNVVTHPPHIMEKCDKKDVTKNTKVPPPTLKKPKKAFEGENNPLKLEIKSSMLIEEHNENLNKTPPPVPPSHTKPKLVRTPSEEKWLTNCKKILEIPPPLRRRAGEGSYNAFPSESQSCQQPLLPQTNNISKNRFSVSQSELLGKISEMNLNNKRISLPPNITLLNLPISQIDVEDHDDYYSSISNINKHETENQEDTYEDIEENNYAEINEYSEEADNIYDDVVGGENQGEDHYEAINCLLVPNAGTGDSDSSCDQSNSLYGLGRPASLATTGSIYQVMGGSETSDEWVDLDNSDDKHESVIIFREKERGRGLVATESWSMKVRRQWSRNSAGGNVKVSSHSIPYFIGPKSEQCLYLSNIDFSSQIVTKGLVSMRTSLCLCNTYEAQEVIVYLGNEDGSDDSVPRSYENIENNDETYCDDFDDSLSDSSFDNDNEAVNPNLQVFDVKRTQPITEGIYGFMKQAGKSMRKHWSIGKSLTRMKKNKSAPNIQTTSSSLGRRGWSFKAKDKPASAQSTFYLHTTNTLTRAESRPETKVDPRRLSTASVLARPTSPPPPPPPRNSIDETSKRKSGINSSANSSGDSESYVEGQRRLSHNGNSMWYIETSTDSTSEHGSSHGSDLNLKFADEPLYQFYAANVAELTLSELVEEVEGVGEDSYEEITPHPGSDRPTALDLVSAAHHRSLWCEVPQVRNSRILDTLTQSQKKLQESKFEVMTSEASYFKSLTVLDKLFSSCPLFSDENILSRDDRKILFGNVNIVRKCSEKLLAALQTCWQECILMQGICEIVHDHIKAHREVYVKYCTNQISMDRTLKRLKQTNSNFNTVLTQLETDPECQSLTLYSFLMLPMQRITRLRLLIETMLSHLDPSDSDFTPCQRTLDVLNKCVAGCNEGARSQERHEEMVKLSKQLEFPPEMNVPVLCEGNSRWLVRSGQVTQVNMDAKQTFGRRLSRTGPKFTLFLFTDLFLVTKKKSEESYHVVDHCQRSLMETQEMSDFPGNNRFLIQITLLENSDNKTVEMTLSCDNETERQRWLQVLSLPQSTELGETLYEGWDCPQVSVVYGYSPTQPDELTLALGDVINVLRKSEGWFFGERTRDGEKGWFPGSYTREIASKHVRARNLKQRHKLLRLSADFVQQQKKIKS